MSTSIVSQQHAAHTQAIRTKQEEMEVLSLAQASQKKDSVIPANSTSTTTVQSSTTAQPKTVKVSNINVADERFHLSMIGLLGCVLSQLVLFEESQYPNGRGPISMFHTAYVPSISIGSYLKRIALYTKVSSEVLIQSVLHVHQLMQRSQNPLIVNKLNIHRLLLTSIMATAKFFDDAHYNNSYFSFVGGVPLKELNALEVEFLSLLNFDFYVNTQTYQYFYSMVVEKNIHQNGCTCSSLLHGLPKSLPVSEYTPDPDVLDFPEPLPCVYDTTVDSLSSGSSSSSMEDTSMEPATLSRAGSIEDFSSSGNSTTSVRSNTTPKQQQPVIVVVVPPQPSALLDDMGEELGSIRIEEDPMSTGTDEESDGDATPAQTPKISAVLPRTPKRTLSAAHLQVQHTSHHTLAAHRSSASPPSFLSSSSMTSASSTLSSSTIESSPVSSSYASSVSSYQPSRQRMTQQVSYHTSSQHASHSPSISLSSTFHHSHAHRWGSVVAEGEEVEGAAADDYLVATPRQSSVTPLAKAYAQGDIHMSDDSAATIQEKERFYASSRDNQNMTEDPTIIM